MEKTIFIWIAVIAIITLLLVFRLVSHFRVQISRWLYRHHVVTFGKESDMFYCPGDEDKY